MIPKDIHNKLMSKWKGRKYADRDRLKKRTHHLELLLPLLKGKHVLELGSNAGITAYEICKHSKRYVGVEPDKNYYEQSKFMKPYLPEKSCFMHGNLQDFLNSYGGGMDALVICIALYLLNKKEIKLLEKRIFPKCDIVIIQERKAKRPSNFKYNPYKLHKPKNIRKFLISNGFDTDVYFSFKEKFFEVIGVNKRNDKEN